MFAKTAKNLEYSLGNVCAGRPPFGQGFCHPQFKFGSLLSQCVLSGRFALSELLLSYSPSQHQRSSTALTSSYLEPTGEVTSSSRCPLLRLYATEWWKQQACTRQNSAWTATNDRGMMELFFVIRSRRFEDGVVDNEDYDLLPVSVPGPDHA